MGSPYNDGLLRLSGRLDDDVVEEGDVNDGDRKYGDKGEAVVVVVRDARVDEDDIGDDNGNDGNGKDLRCVFDEFPPFDADGSKLDDVA